MRSDDLEKEVNDYWATCLRTRLVSTDGVSACSSVEIVDRTRDMLLAELKSIQHLITLTVARVNDLSITARLPSELLMHVFNLLAECDPPSSKPLKGDRTRQKEHLGWIPPVTHVCRRWRLIALSAPALWTNIGAPQTGPWMNAMLARSNKVPFTLSACITRDHKVCNAVLKAVSPPYVRRMKGLHLSDEYRKPVRDSDSDSDQDDGYGPLDDRRAAVLAGFKHPAPMLESLTFDNVTKSSMLRSDIFARKLPRLRRLAIRKCEGVRWNAPYLRNLTTLELIFEEHFLPTKLLALLKESAKLENLKVTRRGYVKPKGAIPDEKVSMPSLKSFCFETRADKLCAEFLDRLIIPSTAKKDFRFCTPNAEQSLRIIPLATGFIGTMGILSHLSPSKMKIKYKKATYCSHITLSLYLEDDDDDSRISVQWSTDYQSNLSADDLAAVQLLFGSFDASELTYASVTSEELPDAVHSIFKETFSQMSALTKLTLRGRGIGPLLSLLKTTQPQSEDAEMESFFGDPSTRQSSFLLPSLRCLWVTGAPMDGITTKGDAAGPNLGELLLSVAKKREALGERIPLLEVRSCQGSDPLMPELFHHVGQLSLDSSSRPYFDAHVVYRNKHPSGICKIPLLTS